MAKQHIDEHLDTEYTDDDFSGYRDPVTGLYITGKGIEFDWFKDGAVRRVIPMIEITRPLGALLVYHDSTDGPLQFSVLGGRYIKPDGTIDAFATSVGSEDDNDLTDDAENFIYLDPAGVLQIEANWPASGAYLPIATITTASGIWHPIDSIVDYRQVLRYIDLTDGPTLDISVAAEGVADDIAVTVQVLDVAGVALAGYFALRFWLSDAANGVPTDTPPDDLAVDPDTVIETVTAKVQEVVITDADGQTIITVTEDGDVEWYLNVELDGKIVASAIIDFD